MTPQEFLQKAERIAQDTAEAFKNRKSIETHIPNSFIVPYEEFDQKYGANLHLDSTGLEALEFDVLVFDGDLTLNNDLTSYWVNELFQKAGSENHLQAMFVNGNLSVAGDILDNEYLYLQVAGDVYCDYVFCQYGRICVQGNLTTLLGVAGDYQDGMVIAQNENSIPYLVSNFQYINRIKIGSECIVIEDGGIGETYYEAAGRWLRFEDSPLMLKDDVLPNSIVDVKVFFDYVKRGENPLISAEEYQANKKTWKENE